MQGVPTWIPFPLFWTYVVGLGLLTAGLSILANRVVRLSAPMLAGMLFLFVLPNYVSTSQDSGPHLPGR